MRATVLLLEDDPALRDLLHLAIEGWGYRVVGAADPAGALRLAREEPRIDVVVADLGALRTARHDVLDSIRASNPAARPVYISGHLAGSTPPLEETEHRFLQKPFALADLEDALSEAPRDAAA